MPKALAKYRSSRFTLEIKLEQDSEYFYGGIIKHFKALQAFLHATSSSYKDELIKPRYEDQTIYLVVDAMMPAYYGFASICLAGLAGIMHKIKPTALKLSDSLASSLSALSDDHEFLTTNKVFTKSQIDTYVTSKKQQLAQILATPSALEFKLYDH